MDLLKSECENYVNAWCEKDMNIDEAMKVIVLSQTYPLGEQTVQGCMKSFVSDKELLWEELQKHRMFSHLDPKNVQRITEERVKYLENPLRLKRKEMPSHQTVRFGEVMPMFASSLSPH